MSAGATILFAGGGSGGHIFPNLAIAERLRDVRGDVAAHFLVSTRPLDAQVLSELGVAFSALPVQPIPRSPVQWLRWWGNWRRSVARVRQLIREKNVAAVVATGGFVSGPAVIAAKRCGVPVALVSLDAVPGKANRWMARKATQVFTVHPVPDWPRAVHVGMPLRRNVIGAGNAAEARRSFGLDPIAPTILICGGSQGAETLNDLMAELAQRGTLKSLGSVQVLHLCGTSAESRLQKSYADAGVRAAVLAFCDRMADAWFAATVSITRCGAGGVAEAWANAIPAIFLPYPFHKDQHQRLNAEPLVKLGGGILLDDHIDAATNAEQITPVLAELLRDEKKRAAMIDVMRKHAPPNGTEVIAAWITSTIRI